MAGGGEGGERHEAEVRLSWTSRWRMRYHSTIKNILVAVGQHEKGRDAPWRASGGGGSNDNNDSSKENESKDCDNNNGRGGRLPSPGSAGWG
jgi:hypothetical protein